MISSPTEPTNSPAPFNNQRRTIEKMRHTSLHAILNLMGQSQSTHPVVTYAHSIGIEHITMPGPQAALKPFKGGIRGSPRVKSATIKPFFRAEFVA
ncbi:hypothetical protein GCM10017767_24420 [Halomonas urumqiensis]|nr:hypothetical protein GCM10017767_24420 [Halomonas urumqiensis]